MGIFFEQRKCKKCGKVQNFMSQSFDLSRPDSILADQSGYKCECGCPEYEVISHENPFDYKESQKELPAADNVR